MNIDGQHKLMYKYIGEQNEDTFDFDEGITLRQVYDDTYIRNATTPKPTIYHLDKNNQVSVYYEGEAPETYDKHVLQSGYTETLNYITQRIIDGKANTFLDRVSEVFRPKHEVSF
ncbi:MAG: hypothetical protein EON54_03450 [Alcaligenaceae bacterium]|nr:MAG: hypothetical protein EON54_03450 [Alcaligenaceae bacterium]